ncbi:FAD-dependent oxidoreductase [Sporosarcina ureilytica]|uniref:Oxidoreductase n=1 Tax=Sporosarcina ureilytica TaxID=298596 RepID=A0A1D8JDT3_9BACL|nr:FAD-dependent oxidoreductase [Sporosarcina ureilytica]AOV06866.1 oxidoreductase [Sporosarcina ureilytica]
MSFLKDIFSIFKKSDLALITKYKEADDIYTFLFKKDNDLNWKAGQHGLFTITHRKIKNGIRPFTVASSPNEDVIRITTKINDHPSEFKKALLELEEGMTIKMSGPVGSFYLKDKNPSLLIAGGIGITPFRAMVKQIEEERNDSNRQLKLLYLDSENVHIYKEELDEVVHNNAMEITYLTSRDELYKEIDQFVSLYADGGKYFVAGSKAMVDSISRHLKENAISRRNIKKDSFMGY